MALKAVCVMKGDGATQGVINICQEVSLCCVRDDGCVRGWGWQGARRQ